MSRKNVVRRRKKSDDETNNRKWSKELKAFTEYFLHLGLRILGQIIQLDRFVYERDFARYNFCDIVFLVKFTFKI